MRPAARITTVVQGAALAMSVAVGLTSACTPAPDGANPPATSGTGADTTLVESQAGEPSPSPLLDSPLPPPVHVRDTPDAVTLADPSFEPLPGARAEHGTLGGATYQIELPDNWNGRLVLWMEGFGALAPEAKVSPPSFRRSLIAGGTAWASSSFSSTSLIPGRAADETAALWDHFVSSHGRPKRTYVTGASMGGWATHIAAERYANRFDGALGLCGAVGTTPAMRISVEQLVAAAYVLGIDQAAFDAAPSLDQLTETTIRPALSDPATRARYESIMVGMTGGPRAFAREGFRFEEETNWQRARLLVVGRLVPPHEGPYRLAPGTDADSDDLNRRAIQLPFDDGSFRRFSEGMEVTGQLAIPLLTMHTTGDGQVPIEQAQLLHQRVAAAGRSDLLVQRVVQDSGHCGFTTTEEDVALDSLFGWVERGLKTEGTDLSRTDLTHLDRTFELQPRPGLPAADDVVGAGERVTARGSATLDGASFDAQWLGAVVRAEGLVTPCQVALAMVDGGRYEITVLGDNEGRGCGRPGAEVVLWTYVNNTKLYATQPFTWPTGREAPVDVAFSTTNPGKDRAVTELKGEVYRPDGRHAPPGTLVEAYVGGARCGVATVRRVGSYAGFSLSVAGPDTIAKCQTGALVTFRVDGKPAPETARNIPDQAGTVDLTTG